MSTGQGEGWRLLQLATSLIVDSDWPRYFAVTYLTGRAAASKVGGR
jgi:hypothetical protein